MVSHACSRVSLLLGDLGIVDRCVGLSGSAPLCSSGPGWVDVMP